MTSLNTALSGVSILGLDSSAVIYFIEAHPRYDALVTVVFDAIERGCYSGFTSVITLTEVRVRPLRIGDRKLAAAYRELLLESDHFSLIPVDSEIAERAADLRARYGLRTPDAMQIATAINSGCHAFLTNDTTMQRVTDLRVLLLNEMSL